VWLDGTDLATMTVVGDRVASWVSKDPAGRVFTTTHSVNQRPYFDAAGVRFANIDGASISTNNTQCLVASAPWSAAPPVSVYAVVSHQLTASRGPVIAFGEQLVNGAFYTMLATNSVTSRCGGGDHVAGYPGHAHWPQNTPGLLRGVIASGNDRRFQFNHEPEIVNTGSCYLPSGHCLIGVERIPTSSFPSFGLRGTVHEIIVVNAALSAEQEALLEEYLGHKNLWWWNDSVVWTRIAGRALTAFGAPADRVRIVEANRLGVAAVVRTNRLGEWEHEGWIPREYLVIHESLGCAPVVHGPYTATAS
jgi:hypothetical protein